MPEDYVSMEELEQSYSSVEEEILTDDNGRTILPAIIKGRPTQLTPRFSLRHGKSKAWRISIVTTSYPFFPWRL